MGVVKAERFTALKAKVKAECLRRSHSGSVAGYGGAAYDFSVVPGAGKTIRQEHRDKLSGPLSAINSSQIPATSGAGTVREAELAAMETKVTAWSARSVTDQSGSDCKSGCTGMCYTGCTTGCSGCGSGCPGSCSGCGSGCPGGCSGCGGSCSYGCDGCDGGCDGCSGCGSGCPNGCSGYGSGCPSGCSSCGGACSSGCSGCGSGCPNTCTENCAYNK